MLEIQRSSAAALSGARHYVCADSRADAALRWLLCTMTLCAVALLLCGPLDRATRQAALTSETFEASTDVPTVESPAAAVLSTEPRNWLLVPLAALCVLTLAVAVA